VIHLGLRVRGRTTREFRPAPPPSQHIGNGNGNGLGLGCVPPASGAVLCSTHPFRMRRFSAHVISSERASREIPRSKCGAVLTPQDPAAAAAAVPTPQSRPRSESITQRRKDAKTQRRKESWTPQERLPSDGCGPGPQSRATVPDGYMQARPPRAPRPERDRRAISDIALRHGPKEFHPSDRLRERDDLGPRRGHSAERRFSGRSACVHSRGSVRRVSRRSRLPSLGMPN
jgi:hypothetical protein